MSRYARERYLALVSVLLAAAITSAAAADDTTVRTWTSRAGNKIEAAFVKVQHGTVHLRKANGGEIRIRKALLSPEDQAVVDTLAPAPQTGSAKKGAQAEQEKAPDALYELFGPKLTNAKKQSLSVDELAGKTIGVYFSAHWCPPCRQFTPVLVEFYNDLEKKDAPFEIVFVSSDRDKGAMSKYMKEMDMPWLALPYGDAHKASLSAKYSVRGIPKLVVLDSAGELISENGRAA